jgi:transmembrane sensor
MPPDHEHINRLLQRYKDNTATNAEKEELTAWYRQKAYQDAVFPEYEAEVEASMRERLNRQIKPVERTYRTAWLAAASVLLVMAVGLGVFYFTRIPTAATVAGTTNADVQPGGNKAILTLADGSKIVLEDVPNGPIASDGNFEISKTGSGQLVYTIKSAGNATEATDKTHLLEIPRGGQYQVAVPDGTRIWLNTSSTLSLPLSFMTGERRKVELEGEAYFEVAHDPRRGFTVATELSMVNVLGTHFNVRAYADEHDTRTSLVEGKVVVGAGNQLATLQPGQEARVKSGFNLGEKVTVTAFDTEEAIAWKNGYFHFNDARLEDIMRSISRWYNVEVVFQDNALKDETFGAVTTRTTAISVLLHTMEQTGNAKFQLENRTITITAKQSP